MKRGGLILVLALLVAGCGKPGTPTYSVEATRLCLVKAGTTIDHKLDFVASTATGGAFRAHFGGNFVTVAFGATPADAANIDQAYRRFAGKNVGIDDVLRTQGNAVMLWHEHPQDAALSRLQGCLK